MTFSTVQTTISQMYQETITSDAAEKRLANALTKEQMAEFIVEAFNRGWISKGNLGLDDEGAVI